MNYFALCFMIKCFPLLQKTFSITWNKTKNRILKAWSSAPPVLLPIILTKKIKIEFAQNTETPRQIPVSWEVPDFISAVLMSLLPSVSFLNLLIMLFLYCN